MMSDYAEQSGLVCDVCGYPHNSCRCMYGVEPVSNSLDVCDDCKRPIGFCRCDPPQVIKEKASEVQSLLNCKQCFIPLSDFSGAGMCAKCYGDAIATDEDREETVTIDVIDGSKIELKARSPQANEVQHGGDHYKNKTIEPWDYIAANDLDFFQGSAIKYITRFREKNGEQDLRKAIHFIEKLIEVEYGKD